MADSSPPASLTFNPPGARRTRTAPRARIVGQGVVVRFAPIKGITPKAALAGRLWLPGIIDQWDLTEPALHNEYDTLSAGQFSQAAMGPASARRLRTTTLNTLTMDMDPAWFIARGQDAYGIRASLSEILRHRKAVHLLMYMRPDPASGKPEVDMYCTLRQTTQTIRPGEADTRYVSVDVSEWRDPNSGRLGSTSQQHSRSHGNLLPTLHKLAAGDSLGSLSNTYYGSYAHWRDIRDANGITKRFGEKTAIVTLPGRWKVGANVAIPIVASLASGSLTFKGR